MTFSCFKSRNTTSLECTCATASTNCRINSCLMFIFSSSVIPSASSRATRYVNNVSRPACSMTTCTSALVWYAFTILTTFGCRICDSNSISQYASRRFAFAPNTPMCVSFIARVVPVSASSHRYTVPCCPTPIFSRTTYSSANRALKSTSASALAGADALAEDAAHPMRRGAECRLLAPLRVPWRGVDVAPEASRTPSTTTR
mmetsp:Transcript_5574/g.21838  ORF Transcript_5574/g.21838 Transcript_5574/m.21838 type:complete len:202 (+) Transcript_5574:1959-2564(+)